MTHHVPDTTTRSSESGIALVIAMFMTLVLSVMASSLMFVSKTETVSSFSYKTMSQARYAAESGLHNAANFLLEETMYVAPLGPGAGANSIDDYVITGERVTTLDGADVVLSSIAGESNYPVQGVIDDFIAAFQDNELDMSPGVATFSARATLVSMRQITDAITSDPVTLQTWEITGRGRAGGRNGAEVEVSAVIERQESPVFKYAAFAMDPGCSALTFGGGAGVDSYDSTVNPGVKPVPDDYGGDVGTNGNMQGLGSTTVVNGSLSTPRSGVGTCTAGNITALSTSSTNGATVTGGILKLGQAVENPDPPAIDPLPPTGNVDFNGGCAAGTAAFCSTVAGVTTINPALTGDVVTLADVRVQAGTNLHLQGGTYIVNSLSIAGKAQITVDPGQEVIFRVAGVGINTPIDIAGNGVVNDSYDPMNLQFIYGGDKTIKVTGGTSSAALVYAPNATASLSGGIDFYGALVAREISEFGGATIHYDRNLQNTAMTAGNPMMGSFTWRTF